jgi:hypothetical protein
MARRNFCIGCFVGLKFAARRVPRPLRLRAVGSVSFFAYVTSLGMLLSEVIANAEALLSQWFGIKTLLLLRAICHHLARLLSEKQEYTQCWQRRSAGVAFE